MDTAKMALSFVDITGKWLNGRYQANLRCGLMIDVDEICKDIILRQSQRRLHHSQERLQGERQKTISLEKQKLLYLE